MKRTNETPPSLQLIVDDTFLPEAVRHMQKSAAAYGARLIHLKERRSIGNKRNIAAAALSHCDIIIHW
jgi:hypothetical protein